MVVLVIVLPLLALAMNIVLVMKLLIALALAFALPSVEAPSSTSTGPRTGPEVSAGDDSEVGNDGHDDYYDDPDVEQDIPSMWLRVNFRTEVQLTIVVSKRELTRQYINARNSGRRQARKPRRAAQNVREKLSVLPNLLTALAASPGPCPVQQSFRVQEAHNKIQTQSTVNGPEYAVPTLP